MLGFLSALFTVAMPVILIVAVIISAIVAVVIGIIYKIVDHACAMRINDIQGHHICR